MSSDVRRGMPPAAPPPGGGDKLRAALRDLAASQAALMRTMERQARYHDILVQRMEEPEKVREHLETHEVRLAAYAETGAKVACLTEGRTSRTVAGATPMELDAMVPSTREAPTKGKGKAPDVCSR